MRLIIVYSLALIIIGCVSGSENDSTKDYYLDSDSFNSESLKMIEQRTGIIFPDGVVGLHMFYQGSQIDPSFVAKLEIPSSAHQAMVQKIEQLRYVEGAVTGSLRNKVAWWISSEATIRVKRQFLRDMNYVQVLLCKEKERWVLYLEWIKI